MIRLNPENGWIRTILALPELARMAGFEKRRLNSVRSAAQDGEIFRQTAHLWRRDEYLHSLAIVRPTTCFDINILDNKSPK